MNSSLSITDESVISKIFIVRGKKVMLDRDLAEMYGVETKVLNQAIKRNLNRFPPDFMFKMTKEELENWKSQIVTSNKEKIGLRKLPNIFTEQGVAMLSSVLNSDTAIEVNIQIIRIFTRIRELVFTHKEIFLKLEQLENSLITLDGRTKQNDDNIQTIFKVLKQLLNTPQSPRKRIGFNNNE